MAELKPIIETSFTQYSGAVLQSRALIDVRDCLKPSARQIFYCMETDKFTHNKPFKKTLKAIGSASRMYIHGDSSCEGVIMRAGQPFAMRYPLIEIEGGCGNPKQSGNWSAPRYTSARLSELGDSLFTDIQKDTITEWRDNYDDTEQYPAVLSSVGYYNICNGSFGIGIGMSSSIPQFNIKDINLAMEKLLLNPSIDDDEIIPMPDFASGGYLLNPEAVKESLKNGTGDACLLRAVINYDSKENALVVTEIPYAVYTKTIRAELDAIVTSDDNPGIDRYNDLTKATPLIKIYLNKGANIQRILQYLYKNTSLQSWYSINMTMLENGRFPRVFSLRDALIAHIEHEKTVYRRGFEFDKKKAEDRLHIVEGLLIARANIDEVIKIIKSAESPNSAKNTLMATFSLTDIQAQAILDMKLSRLTHLEVAKLEDEKKNLIDTIRKLELILNNAQLFNEHIIRRWRAVSDKFGDERRTKITPLEEEKVEQTTEKDVVHMVTDGGEIIIEEPFKKMNNALKTSPYYKKNIVFGYKTTNLSTNFLYNAGGQICKITPTVTDVSIICPIGAFSITDKKFIIHVTDKGTVKKSLITEYNNFKKNTTVGKIRDGEKIVYIGAVNDDDFLFMLGTNGKVLKVKVSEFNSTGKNTIGVKGMSSNIVSATSANEDGLIVVICEDKIKVTKASDYSIGGKGCLGNSVAENTTKLFKINGSDFYLIENGVKIAYFSPSDYIIKGHTASGNKVSTENGVIW